MYDIPKVPTPEQSLRETSRTMHALALAAQRKNEQESEHAADKAKHDAEAASREADRAFEAKRSADAAKLARLRRSIADLLAIVSDDE